MPDLVDWANDFMKRYRQLPTSYVVGGAEVELVAIAEAIIEDSLPEGDIPRDDTELFKLLESYSKDILVNDYNTAKLLKVVSEIKALL